jgi:hypothetical protein
VEDNVRHEISEHWGARKIRERLLRRLPHAVKTPAASTIHAVLDRHGLVRPMGQPRSRAQDTPLSEGLLPNDLWYTDYEGEFQRSDRRYPCLRNGQFESGGGGRTRTYDLRIMRPSL